MFQEPKGPVILEVSTNGSTGPGPDVETLARPEVPAFPEVLGHHHGHRISSGSKKSRGHKLHNGLKGTCTADLLWIQYLRLIFYPNTISVRLQSLGKNPKGEQKKQPRLPSSMEVAKNTLGALRTRWKGGMAEVLGAGSSPGSH